MRKLLLTILALMMMSASCFAASWEWVGANPYMGLSYDKDSLVFEVSSKQNIVNRDMVKGWVKFVYDEAYAQKEMPRKDTKYVVCKFSADLVGNRILNDDYIVYNKDGKILEQGKQKKGWEHVAPDTLGEFMFNSLKKHVRAHTEEIEQRTRGN